ncbi:hypothetical protein SEA_KEANU_85 [Streptomyces phage Keanu]|nr:hypothetical protein SEA_KEANU_85 [Streptomyces phage Keanu]
MSETAVETPEVQAEATTEEKPKREKKVVEPTACACQPFSGQDAKGETLSTGCTEVTPRTFRPGHDAKLKSLLIKVGSAGNQVTRTVDGEAEGMDVLHAAELFGFRDLVEKSVNAAKAKQEEREAKAQERADKKAKAEAAKAEAKAKREREAATKRAHAKAIEEAAEAAKGNPGPAKAKVGRTTVDGEILADGTFKYKKGDEDVETTNYTVVIDPASVPVPDVEA